MDSITQTVPKTWKPAVAGVLNIVAGVFGIMATTTLIIALSFGLSLINWAIDIPRIEAIPAFLPWLLWTIPILLFLISMLALVGGIFALQRRRWGWVLAGSIAAVFASISILRFLPVGIVAIIFTSISKDEFE